MNKIANHTFSDENLLKQAMTHSSFSRENYERFEFLGDSILSFIVAKYFFKNTKDGEGVLTKKRAYFVSEKHLSKIFDEIVEINAVKIGKSCSKITNSIKCDIVEAIIGAIYLDSGLDACESFILQNFKLDSEMEQINYKSELQEYAQANKMNLEYIYKQMQGESHNPTFVFECICGEYSTTQTGKTKQIAQQNCAKVILQMLNKEQKA